MFGFIGHVHDDYDSFKKLLNCYKQHECKVLFLFGNIDESILEKVGKDLRDFSMQSLQEKVYLCLNGNDSVQKYNSVQEAFANTAGIDTYYYTTHTQNVMIFHGTSDKNALTKIKDDEEILKSFEGQNIISKDSSKKTYKPVIDMLVTNEPVYGLPKKLEGNLGLNQILQHITSPLLIAVPHQSIVIKPFKTRYIDDLEHTYIGIPPVSKEFAILGKILIGSKDAKYELITKPIKSLGN